MLQVSAALLRWYVVTEIRVRKTHLLSTLLIPAGDA
jgi:hypothetical protein